MPLSLVLVLSVALFAAAGALLLASARVRAAVLRRPVVERVLPLAVLLSAGSYFVRTSGASGTGTRTAHGFPKPFYFTWRSWEHPVSYEGVNWLYLAGNCVAWLAVAWAGAVAWAALRRRRRLPD